MDLTTAPTTHLQRLAETLWEERHLVVELLYRLTCARLLLAADQQRFVASAIDEVEDVTDRLRQVELHREGVLLDVAAALGGDAHALTLETLASATAEPWRGVFADHRRAFLSLAQEIEETTEANRELATQALGRVRHSIGILSGSDAAVQTYDARGRQAATPGVPLRLDRAL